MAKHKEVAISVKDLHKSFKLPHEQHSGMKQAMINILRKDKKRGYEIQHVLKGLDFEIEKGDFFGIVGRNGSGKSTLLKTLAGIYSPDKGVLQVNGTLVPFIELGVGFNPELTGRENVFLNGALLGFSREEMEAMYADIVKFAELEKFMDQKLKNYSSGMQVRLAFSIAIRADGDILLLDEVLAVGDEAFQRKCNDYFRDLKKRGKTVILVTHDMESVRKYCTKAILIKDGKIEITGTPEDVASEYSLENLETPAPVKEVANNTSSIIKDFKVELLSPRKIDQNQEICVKFSYRLKEKQKTRLFMDFYDLDRNVGTFMGKSPTQDTEKVELTLRAKLPALNDTKFIVHSTIKTIKGEVLFFNPENSCPTFVLKRTDKTSKDQTAWSALFDMGRWE